MKYEPSCHVVLYEPEIPYNTGNIGRTCVAIGAKLWLVQPLGFSISDYYLRRAGLDYWELLEYQVVENWQELRQQLPTDRLWYYTKTATRFYSEATYQPGDAFVFGSESKGLPKELMQAEKDFLLRMPTRTEVRSLNLSNTVAIATYEACRQWGFRGE